MTSTYVNGVLAMNELYKILDRQVGAVEQLASNDFGEPGIYKSDRRQLVKYAHNLHARGTLLLTSYERITVKALSYCHDEQIKLAFNAETKAFRAQRHNLLKCYCNDVERINELCMTEELKYGGIAAAFNDITHVCDIRAEFSARRESLEVELAEQYEKTVQSPFYASSRECHCPSFRNPQQTAGFAADYVAAAKAKREHLVQLAANFECYKPLLIAKLESMQKRSLCADTDAEAMASFNTLTKNFRSREHGLLMCFEAEVQLGNALCMTEELETEGVTGVFDEIGDPCNARQTIEGLNKHLKQAFVVLQDKLFKSPFYLMEMNAKTGSATRMPEAQSAKVAEEAPTRK